jgi:MFS family permease
MARAEHIHPPTPPDPRASFYGWKIVAVAFIVDFVAVGFFFYSYGVFLKPIAAELAGSRFGASLGISVTTAVGAIAAPFVGRALDRMSIKRIMIAGTISIGIGFFLMSRINEIWQFYLTMGTFLGFGMSMMAGLASGKLVTNWFDAKRGTAFGIATVGVSLSGFVMPAIATWLIAEVGWRGGYQVYALSSVAIVVPLVAIFIVNRPEDLGLRPDGGAQPEASKAPDCAAEAHWRTSDVLRERNFWAIAIPFGLALSSLSAVLIHMVPYADDLGISGYRAAAIYSFAAGAGALGKIFFGRLMDLIEARLAILASFGGQLLGLVLLMQGREFGFLLAAGILFGFSMGGVIPLQGAVTGEAFGRLSFGKVTGLLRPVQLPISIIGVPVAGWIFDSTGSYALAFQLFIGFYVAASLLIGALRLKPTDSQRG